MPTVPRTKESLVTFLFLLTAAAISFTYWILPAFTAHDRSLDGLMLFRYDGDSDYLPHMSAMANLRSGDISVMEFAGTGIRTFPYASAAFHAVLFRLGGPAGFILADFLLVILHAWLLRRFLINAGVHSVVAASLSLAVISGFASRLVASFAVFIHHPIPLHFWSGRFPRPFVTELIFLMFLILATRLMKHPDQSAWWYAAFGATLAAVLQGDPFEVPIAFAVAGASAAVAFAQAPRNPRPLLKGLGIAAGTSILGALPFAYQQLNASPDVKRRWGVFRLDRPGALWPSSDYLLTAAVVLAIILAALSIPRLRRQKGTFAALIAAAIAVAASVVNGPVWAAIVHEVIQVENFPARAERMMGFAVVLVVGLAITELKSLAPWRERAAIPMIALALVAGLSLSAAWRSSRDSFRSDRSSASAQSGPFPHYRSDFGNLHNFLDASQYSKAVVLGTFDAHLADWWMYKQRYLYLADPFSSSLPDRTLEARLFQFLHLLGTSSDEFGHLLDNTYFLRRVVGHWKYFATAMMTPWPLQDYSSKAQRRIAASWFFNIELPLSEKQRLLTAYQQAQPVTTNRLDLLIFEKDVLRTFVHPERDGRFREVWSNSTFEVWAPTQ